MSKRVQENRTVGVYSYYEKNNKICTGSIKELAEKLNKTPNSLYQLSYKPTCFRRLKIEGYLVPMYEVYTREGIVVFKGSVVECADFMCVNDESVIVALYETKSGQRNGRCGGYLVRRAGREFRNDC
jgi:hypothetical protein